MIAATGSGCGKTTITCGLLEILKRRGLSLRSFKCGPDYIDPMFHRNVLGIPSKNLDLFFTDEAQASELFWAGNDAEVSIAEGVMGLYDGMDTTSSKGSSYHLACALDIPVILVVDAHGMGRSVIAVIKGFQLMDEEGRIKGVILNRISPSYYASLKPAIEEETGLKVVGYCPKLKDVQLESRHLGLRQPHEVAELKEKLAELSGQLEKSLEIDEVLRIAEACSLPAAIVTGPKEHDPTGNDKSDDGGHVQDHPVKIAVARDEAFSFYYEDNLRLLREAGAKLISFSPLHDKSLPEGVSGILLGGGYPELYAGELAENVTMKESVRLAIGAGMPSLAECGGFMYLHKTLIDETGGSYPMAGVIDGTCVYAGHLVRFGYVSLKEKKPCFFGDSSLEVRGHEFHYYDSDANGESCTAVKPVTKRSWDCGYTGENHWWGFAHLYYPSCPEFALQFVKKCEGFMKSKAGVYILSGGANRFGYPNMEKNNHVN